MTTPHRRHATPERSDRGSVSVLMCVIVLIGVTLAVFLIEAGSTIQAATRADIAAAEAARAAVAAAGPDTTATGTQLAVTAAQSYLAAAGAAGTVTVTGPRRIDVAVTVNIHTPLLGLPVTETAHHTAQLLIGARQGEGP